MLHTCKKMKGILLPKDMKCIQEIFVIVGASHLEYIPLLSKACLKEDKGSIDGPSLPLTSAYYAQSCHYQAQHHQYSESAIFLLIDPKDPFSLLWPPKQPQNAKEFSVRKKKDFYYHFDIGQSQLLFRLNSDQNSQEILKITGKIPQSSGLKIKMQITADSYKNSDWNSNKKSS